MLSAVIYESNLGLGVGKIPGVVLDSVLTYNEPEVLMNLRVNCNLFHFKFETLLSLISFSLF